LASALTEDAATVSEAHLAQHALSASACDRILSEAIHGEEQLTEAADETAQLRLRLGLSRPEKAARAASGSRRPGERAPTRDPLQAESQHAG
jgi:hypothetical protein